MEIWVGEGFGAKLTHLENYVNSQCNEDKLSTDNKICQGCVLDLILIKPIDETTRAECLA